MCGRYQFTAEQCEEIRRIAQAIQQKYGKGAWTPGDVRPANVAPVILSEGGKLAPRLMKWGYQPPGTLVINARAETAAAKPMFRESVRRRRCLIPSTGFYEWDANKRKYFFTLPGQDVLYMAGLYERRDNEDCYCVLTTAPNKSMQPIHDRMPLILTGSSGADGLPTPMPRRRFWPWCPQSWYAHRQRARSACGKGGERLGWSARE